MNTHLIDELLINNMMAANKYDSDFMTEKRYQYIPERIPTGIESLDACLGGGIPTDTLTVIRGIPGAGKTTLVTQIAKNIAASVTPVVYFCCEDDYLTLRTKMVTQEVFLANGKDLLSTPSTQQQLTIGCFDRLSKYALSVTGECHKELATVLSYNTYGYGSNFVYIDSSDMSAKDIYDCIDAFVTKNLIRPVVIVDYLQRLTPSNTDYAGNGSDKIAIDDNIHILRSLAVDNRIAVLVTGSVAKTYFSKPDATEADEGSNQILHTADNLLVLMDSKESDRSSNSSYRTMDLKIIKQRRGMLGTIPLRYYSKADYFSDCSSEEKSIVHEKYLEIIANDNRCQATSA